MVPLAIWYQWVRKWIGAKGDPGPWRHVASLNHSELNGYAQSGVIYVWGTGLLLYIYSETSELSWSHFVVIGVISSEFVITYLVTGSNEKTGLINNC